MAIQNAQKLFCNVKTLKVMLKPILELEIEGNLSLAS